MFAASAPAAMISAFYYTALRALGLPAARRRRNAAAILCYHNVVEADLSPDVAPPSLHMRLPRFREQMRWLAETYQVVPLHELLARRQSGAPLQRTAALTFDDAYAGVFTHALPVLRELGLPATAFVVTGAPDTGAAFWWDHPAVLRHGVTPARRERWLAELRGDRVAILADLHAAGDGEVPPSLRPADWHTIRAALSPGGGLDLGAHSVTHRVLPGLSERDLLEEVSGSREQLIRRTGAAPAYFTYPYGLWDDNVRAAVKTAGYAAGLTLDFARMSPETDPWSAPRINIPGSISRVGFEAWTAGLGPPLRPRE